MKLLLSMAEDIRVVLIKFADRLHNMRTIQHMPREKQLQKATETMELYAPLAHRFGLFSIRVSWKTLVSRLLIPTLINSSRVNCGRSESSAKSLLSALWSLSRRNSRSRASPLKLKAVPSTFILSFERCSVSKRLSKRYTTSLRSGSSLKTHIPKRIAGAYILSSPTGIRRFPSAFGTLYRYLKPMVISRCTPRLLRKRDGRS